MVQKPEVRGVVHLVADGEDEGRVVMMEIGIGLLIGVVGAAILRFLGMDQKRRDAEQEALRATYEAQEAQIDKADAEGRLAADEARNEQVERLQNERDANDGTHGDWLTRHLSGKDGGKSGADR